VARGRLEFGIVKVWFEAPQIHEVVIVVVSAMSFDPDEVSDKTLREVWT
jgi:hypothetical protein